MSTSDGTDKSIVILRDLIHFQSESKNSNLDLIEYLKDKLKKYSIIREGFNLQKNKANLFATIPADDGSLNGGILFSGHTDVVPAIAKDWSSHPYDLRIEQDKLYGRGTSDMKGFIAAVIAMLDKFISAKRNKPIHFAFTYDEEVGCLGGKALVSQLKDLKIKPDIVIVGEPTEMKVVEGTKSCCEYSTQFNGLAAHGSNPEIGVNAVEYCVKYIDKLLELRKKLKKRMPSASRYLPPYSTLQIGKIQGGSSYNVVAAHCRVDWELRTINQNDFNFVHQEMDEYIHSHLLPAMKAVYPQSSIVKEIIGEVEGLEIEEQSKAKQLIMKLTGQKNAKLVSFGTEAGLFQKLGSSVVICGPGSILQAHKKDEFLSIKQLSLCLKFLTDLTLKL